MVALEIMGFDGPWLSVGQTLSSVALYFIWHLAAAAVSDAVAEILKVTWTIQAFVSSNVATMCKWSISSSVESNVRMKPC